MLRKAILFSGNLLALIAGFGLLARFVPPDVWWPPSVISLLLPGLLLVTLLFLLLCLYWKKWRSALLPALILVATMPLIGRLFAFGQPADSSQESSPISVLTANVHSFKDQSWKGMPAETATRFIKDSPPDILLLQEARSERPVSSFIEEVKAASQLSKRHQPQKKTIAIYANEITFVKDVFNTPRGYNGYLISDVKTHLGTIRVINAHLQSNQISGMAGEIGQDSTLAEGLGRAESMFRSYGASAAIRAQQANEIRKAIKESPYPVIVGGDFNDVPSSYTYQRILTPRLRDAWAEAGFGTGTTFTGPLPGLRIDFLLVDTSLSVLDIERIETGYSDHRALRAKIARRK
ncbi:Metal-dependent hydrolase, endonuclease/exonuclease/phosphatase family [Neolewinella agarilytica]|uniref:Metal-dependent hydrolase, endonuclease/exonuclease/phosphatase family n=1 Tax=Neolewinella agarilytica TaxID=478744 RepID=A0A1H9AL90_9BACT|nr:Metal-dependent hydrolase, endonuclease/exonuclease/phosphatase family [Neolewinella agarilytica]